MPDEIVEIMARAMTDREKARRVLSAVRMCANEEEAIEVVLAAFAAIRAEIRKRDAGMIAIKEIDTTRPIGR